MDVDSICIQQPCSDALTFHIRDRPSPLKGPFFVSMVSVVNSENRFSIGFSVFGANPL